jgi:uncharacterized SAM-binding protein YcdF (DUF218 family)
LIIFTLFAIFVAAFLLWRRGRAPVAITGIALFWLLGAGWLTAPLLDWVQSSTHTMTHAHFAPRTVIVLLGGGTEYDDRGTLVPKHDAWLRITETANLYAACKRDAATSCKVIVSGGNPQRHEASEADNYAPYLLRLNVAREDLLLENTSRTTYENAQHVAHILHDQPYDSLILVTSAYHMPRALLDFHIFGLAPHPVISNTRIVRTGALPRLSTLVSANIALHELIGLVQFHVYRAIGWF